MPFQEKGPNETVWLSIRESGSAWIFELCRGDGLSLEPRLKRIRDLLIKTDPVVLEKIGEGGIVSKELPFHRSQNIDFRTVSLARPLVSRYRGEEGLLPFQRYGVAWLIKRKKAILADDMGLGKSVQVAVAIRKLIETGRVVNAAVICPKNLISHWAEIFDKWSPNLIVRSDLHATRLTSASRKSHISITNYESLRRILANKKLTIDALICDEAHRLRNRKAQIFETIRGMNTHRVWLLTGTPIENSEDDFWTLLSIIEPGKFAVSRTEKYYAAIAVQARRHTLRREKSQVLHELPAVSEIDIPVSMSREQEAEYIYIRRSYENRPPLALFTAMRAACDLAPTSKASAKLDCAEDLISKITNKGEKVVVFSYTLAPLRALATRLKEQSVPLLIITGSSQVGERSNILKAFADPNGPAVLLASSKVAAEGLNLTAANHAVFINKWWNPSANAQARDRIIRIGQTRPCFIYYLKTVGTIEDKLDEIISRKKQTFEEIMAAIMKHGLKSLDVDLRNHL